VSAIKVQGRRAHHLTRQGAAPELEPRGVHVRSICERDVSADHVSLELCVSKGYYVRALVRDLSAALGVPAHLTALRRVASGCFTLAEAHAWPPPDDCRVLELAELMPRLLPTFRLNERGVQRARRGQVLERDDFVDALPAEADGADVCAWIDVAGTPVALGGRSGAGYRVRRGFSALASVTDRSTESSRVPQ
jgi:tRNA pseudouridine55 synthase